MICCFVLRVWIIIGKRDWSFFPFVVKHLNYICFIIFNRDSFSLTSQSVCCKQKPLCSSLCFEEISRTVPTGQYEGLPSLYGFFFFFFFLSGGSLWHHGAKTAPCFTRQSSSFHLSAPNDKLKTTVCPEVLMFLYLLSSCCLQVGVADPKRTGLRF